MNRYIVSSILVIAVALSGCDALYYDLDEKPFNDMGNANNVNNSNNLNNSNNSNNANNSNNSNNANNSNNSNNANNMMDMGGDMDMGGSNNNTGTICTPGGDLVGTCNPVAQDCAPDRVCDFFFNVGENRLEAGCNPEADKFVLEEGAACMGLDEKCLPGSFCVMNACRKTCDRATAEGCDSGEFCSTFDAALSVGYCTPACVD